MSETLYKKAGVFFCSNRFLWLIILVGAALRLVRYLHNPSLWFDESVYAVDIIGRDLSEFMQPSPDWSSKPPYGFLILEKIAVLAFGNSEYALRLFPLIFGLLSLVLFCKVAKQHLRPSAVPVALGLFAILDPLVFQASNLKPYSGDLAFALMIFIWAEYVRSKRVTVGGMLLIGLIGAVIIWFSHPSVFVMAGAGACLTWYCLSRKEWALLARYSTAFILWALSFISFYFLYTRNLIENIGFSAELMLQYEKANIPFPPASLSDIKWLLDIFFEVFKFPVGLSFTGLAGLLFLTGCCSIYSEKKEKFFLLMSPMLFTFLAALLHKYPFKGRLIVFLVPFILVFIAEGVDYMREKVSRTSVVPGLVLLALLFVYPLSWAAYHAKNPASHEEIRPVINYVKENWEEGDIVYVHYYSQYAFEYYTRYAPAGYTFSTDDYIVGIAPRGWYRTWRKQQVSKYYSDGKTALQSNAEILKEYVNDLNKVKGRNRVWVLFSSSILKDGMKEENFFRFNLDRMGKPIESFGRPGISAVYLYDLSRVPLQEK